MRRITLSLAILASGLALIVGYLSLTGRQADGGGPPGSASVTGPGAASSASAPAVAVSRVSAVAGTIVSAEGAPVQAFDLTAVPEGPGPTTSRRFQQAEGRFVLMGLRPGRYRIKARTPGQLEGEGMLDLPARRGPVPGAATALHITMQPGAALAGQIVDARSGSAVAGAEAVVLAAGGSTLTADRDGRFLATGLPPGRSVRIRISAPAQGLVPEEIEALTGPSGSTSRLPVVRLLAGDWPSRFGGGPRGLTGIEHGPRGQRMVLTRVRPGSPAERAGLRAGDVVVAIDGARTEGLGWENRSYLLQGRPGSQVLLEVEGASGQNRSVQLTRVAARPAASPTVTRPEH